MGRAGLFETAVGAVVVIAAAFFLAYAWRATDRGLTRDAYTLQAVFGRVDGVTVGADVRMAGVKVGTVSGQRLDTETYEARLDLSISRRVPVPEDSAAKIVTDGLLGGAHVSIEPGASDVMLAGGEVITLTQGSVDLLGLAMQAFTGNMGRERNDQAPPAPEGEF